MGLRVADVDLLARRVRVRRSITQVGGKLIEGRPKSMSGLRTVPIPRRIHDVLAARVSARPRGEPAITSPRGALLSRENWVRAIRWNKQRELIGRPTLRIHDLRHTYASLARSAGADLRLLQRTLGHASITVSAHTYADLYDTDLDAVADALDALSSITKTGLPSGKGEQDGPPQAHHEGLTNNDDKLDEHESNR
jgi:integrase